MIFAILFIIAFLVGLILYAFSRNWIPSVLIPMVLFLISTLLDEGAKDAWGFTLVFGLPIVFFASLLGAYVVQIRTVEDQGNEQIEQEPELTKDDNQ